MNGWMDKLRGGGDHFPAVKAEGEGYPSTHNRIVIVDFDHIRRFPDNDIASMCTVVCGSNRKQGTISHLTMNQNPNEYAKSLIKYWKQPVTIVMYGGDDRVDGSVDFFDSVRDSLQSFGFSIHDFDKGGQSLYRHGILKPDQVILRVSNYSETIKSEKVLRF